MGDNENNNLERLAKLAGIESQYWDIWGNLHRTGEEAKASILGALGIPAESDAAVAAGIEALADAAWAQPLPPVVVSRLGRPVVLPLVLAEERKSDAIPCRVLEETGHGRHFTITPDQGKLLAERDATGERRQRWEVSLPVALPLGYHEFIFGEDAEARTRLIVAPDACYLPEPIAGGARQWGVSTHLYSLRRDGDWGIGDFTGLVDLVEVAGSLGAAVIGLNPLHTLFTHHPERASPYSPSSRLFLNPLYIDPEAAPDFAESRTAQRAAKKAAKELAALQAKSFVDYPAVAAVKQPVFRALYDSFRDKHLSAAAAGDARANAFAAFVREGGEPLRRFALFEVLSADFGGASWMEWPEAYRRCDGPAIAEFASTRREDLEFIQYLQWLADLQLAAAQRRARDLGLPIGLYRDLAVGAAADGADAWIAQDVIVTSATVGCPPDPFNMLGQDWGTPPLHPHALREQGYRPTSSAPTCATPGPCASTTSWG